MATIYNKNEQQQDAKVMLNYRPAGRRRFGSPLKRLLDEAETGLSGRNWWRTMKKMMMMMITNAEICAYIYDRGNWFHLNHTSFTKSYDTPKREHYVLTSWCRVLLEKLIGLQLVKKFPAFHGTRRFITALTIIRHLSLSWANPIQSI